MYDVNHDRWLCEGGKDYRAWIVCITLCYGFHLFPDPAYMCMWALWAISDCLLDLPILFIRSVVWFGLMLLPPSRCHWLFINREGVRHESATCIGNKHVLTFSRGMRPFWKPSVRYSVYMHGPPPVSNNMKMSYLVFYPENIYPFLVASSRTHRAVLRLVSFLGLGMGSDNHELASQEAWLKSDTRMG